MQIHPTDPFQSLMFARPREPWQEWHNTYCQHAALPTLALFRAIAGFLKDAGDTDTYLNERILAPLIDAAREALNLERGQMDGGRASEWLDSIVEARGIAA